MICILFMLFLLQAVESTYDGKYTNVDEYRNPTSLLNKVYTNYLKQEVLRHQEKKKLEALSAFLNAIEEYGKSSPEDRRYYRNEGDMYTVSQNTGRAEEKITRSLVDTIRNWFLPTTTSRPAVAERFNFNKTFGFTMPKNNPENVRNSYEDAREELYRNSTNIFVSENKPNPHESAPKLCYTNSTANMFVVDEKKEPKPSKGWWKATVDKLTRLFNKSKPKSPGYLENLSYVKRSKRNLDNVTDTELNINKAENKTETKIESMQTVDNIKENKSQVEVSRRTMDNDKNSGEVKIKLLAYLEQMFEEVASKIEPVQKIKNEFYNKDLYKIGYIIANIETLEVNLLNMKKDMEKNREYWDDKQIMSLFDELMTSNKVLANLLESLKTYARRNLANPILNHIKSFNA